MQIYIEYAILDNLIINTLLLFLTTKCLRQKRSWFLLIFSATIGTVCAIIFPLLNSHFILLLVLKFVLGFVMCFVAFKPQKFRTLASQFAVFLGLTLLLGGLIMGVFFLLGIPMEALLVSGYALAVPVSVFVLCVALFGFGVIWLAKKLSKHFSLNKKNIIAKIKYNGHELNLKSFVDTGNLLKSGGKPVSMFSEEISKSLSVPKDKIEIVSFSTLNGESFLEVFEADSLEIFDGEKTSRIEKPKLALTNINFKSFDLLLNG
ncbi:MAG: sigma-E processing peptidase SpoIIGA, partial [Firmicutes bacterium]|nr:sigma-E processing peptidase SpoIIGA [Bacillota bacterium]